MYSGRTSIDLFSKKLALRVWSSGERVSELKPPVGVECDHPEKRTEVGVQTSSRCQFHPSTLSGFPFPPPQAATLFLSRLSAVGSEANLKHFRGVLSDKR